jgi:hypothetical protein
MESLAALKAQIGQLHVAGIHSDAATLPSVDGEVVQMLIAPVKADLEDRVELSKGGIAADEETAPDEWANAAQDAPQLIDAGLRAGLTHGQNVLRYTLCFKISARNLALSEIRVERGKPMMFRTEHLAAQAVRAGLPPASPMAPLVHSAQSPPSMPVPWIGSFLNDFNCFAALSEIGMTIAIGIGRSRDDRVTR